jgi:alpha-beta hydrolase superfamily lysophospholipase
VRLRSLIKRGLVVCGVVALAVCVVAWAVGWKLVEPDNHPVPLPARFQAQIVSIPGLGHPIAGWWVDKGGDSPVVLLLHGVRADRSSMVSRAQLLMRHGFSVLLIDLQAHGETPGEAITLGYRESADVVAARDWIKRAAPGRRIGVIGCSLGGASVLLAPQPSGFDAVVLEAVYPRIGRAVENRIQIFLGPLAPVVAPLLLMQLQPRLRIAVSDLEPIRSIGRLSAPVLVVAGSRDERTTLAESQELFDAAAAPKSLWVVEGARHDDFLDFGPVGYEAHVVRFLIDALNPAGEAGSYRFPLEGRHIMAVSLGRAVLQQCSRNTPDAVTAFWEPSEAEVDNLEGKLVLYLAALEKSGSQRPPAGTYDRILVSSDMAIDSFTVTTTPQDSVPTESPHATLSVTVWGRR